MKTLILSVFSFFLAGHVMAQTDDAENINRAAFQKLFSKTEQVDTKFFPSDDSWVSRQTFLLENLKGFQNNAVSQTSKYGGDVSEKYPARGFFYVLKHQDRWKIVDPDGYNWYCKALVSVSPNRSKRGNDMLKEKFKTQRAWADSTSNYIRSIGYNAVGAWSRITNMEFRPENKIPYTLVLNVVTSFGAKKNITKQGNGNIRFKDGIMPVFEPEFKEYAGNHIKAAVMAVKEDPYLLGYFSDNELTFRNDALRIFLKLPSSDPNYTVVKRWAEQHGVDVNNVTAQNEQDFLAFYLDTYFSIVADAVRQADPNHLFLGSRLHSPDKNREIVFQVAGRYADIISYNYYKSWYPEPEITNMWVKASGKPYMITEWYAKGMDSGMPNNSGWGWTVKTQEDRGKYYENFALALLADKNCVGWHWFKYMDNDPSVGSDPSNVDSNKGIVTWDYKPYTALTDRMETLNTQVYPLIKFFDKHIER